MQGSPALFTLSSDMFLKGEEKITKLFPNVKNNTLSQFGPFFTFYSFPQLQTRSLWFNRNIQTPQHVIFDQHFMPWRSHCLVIISDNFFLFVFITQLQGLWLTFHAFLCFPLLQQYVPKAILPCYKVPDSLSCIVFHTKKQFLDRAGL